MNTLKLSIIAMLAACGVVLLCACSPVASELPGSPTSTPIQETRQAVPTETPPIIPTPTETQPIPTQTLQPTETPAPTVTPAATETVAPTETPKPTETPEATTTPVEADDSLEIIGPYESEIGAGLEFGPDAGMFAARFLSAIKARYPNIIPYSSLPGKLAGFRSVRTDLIETTFNAESVRVVAYTVEQSSTESIKTLLRNSDERGNRLVMGDVTAFQEILIYPDDEGNIVFGVGSRDASYQKTIGQTFTNDNINNPLTANALATIMLFMYENPDFIADRGSPSIAFSNPTYSTWSLGVDGLLHYNDDKSGISGISLLKVFQ